jgi:hypothetical protein
VGKLYWNVVPLPIPLNRATTTTPLHKHRCTFPYALRQQHANLTVDAKKLRTIAEQRKENTPSMCNIFFSKGIPVFETIKQTWAKATDFLRHGCISELFTLFHFLQSRHDSLTTHVFEDNLLLQLQLFLGNNPNWKTACIPHFLHLAMSVTPLKAYLPTLLVSQTTWGRTGLSTNNNKSEKICLQVHIWIQGLPGKCEAGALPTKPWRSVDTNQKNSQPTNQPTNQPSR